MQVNQAFRAPGFFQKGEHGRQHQDGFQPFPEQDQKAATKSRRGTAFTRCQLFFGALQRGLQMIDPVVHCSHIRAVAYRASQSHHVRFDLTHECSIRRRQGRLGQLKAIQVSRQCSAAGRFPITRPIRAAGCFQTLMGGAQALCLGGIEQARIGEQRGHERLGIARVGRTQRKGGGLSEAGQIRYCLAGGRVLCP